MRQRRQVRSLFAGFEKQRLLAGAGKDKMYLTGGNGFEPLEQTQCINRSARPGYPYNDPQTALQQEIVPLTEQTVVIIVEQRTAPTL